MALSKARVINERAATALRLREEYRTALSRMEEAQGAASQTSWSQSLTYSGADGAYYTYGYDSSSGSVNHTYSDVIRVTDMSSMGNYYPVGSVWSQTPEGWSRMGGGAAPQAATAVIDMPEMSAIGHVALEVTDSDLSDERKRLAMDVESVLGFSGLRQKIGAPSQLKAVLARLELEVLNPGDVKKYKQQVKDHFRTSNKMADPTWNVVPLRSYTGQIPDFVLSKAVEVKRELPSAEFYVEHFQEDPFLIVTTMAGASSWIGRHASLGNFAISKPDEVMYLEVWDEKSFQQ